ncbi:MAG: D-alanyl-D-alanine carboxypeptidase/D-alanyl-D-alanine endopeptidase [Thermoanaerobaculia bacterium]
MNFNRKLFLASVLALSVSCASRPPAAVAPPEPSPRTLAAAIESEIAASPFDHALWGIHVEEEDGTVLFSKNGGILMMPASNRKLFTMALNESCLDLRSTIPTELWIEGEARGGVLFGNVILKGYGDPSFVGRYDSGARDARLQPFLRALRERGIERVLGSVVGDGSEFDRATFHGTWQIEDLGTSYQTPVDALAFNENVVGVFYSVPSCGTAVVDTDPAFVDAMARIECAPRDLLLFSSDAENTVSIEGLIEGPMPETDVELVSIRDASLYAAQGLDGFLSRNGIAIDAGPRTGRASRDAALVATIESPILGDLLSTMMKASQNLYADTLFKRVAMGIEPATWERAQEIEELFLTIEVGIDPTEFDFEDGSGLSVRNLVTPRAIVQLLRWLDAPPRRANNDTIFATPGEAEGTLRRRLAGFEATFRGKTGTLTGVNALSGYLIGEDGERTYLSLIVNHHAGGSRAAVAILDAIVNHVAGF